MNRPTSVTVFGILNIVFGVLGGLGIAASAVVLFATPRMPEVPTVPDEWMAISLIWGALGSVVLLASGIGLLWMQAWSRVAAVWYAIATLIMTGVSLIVHWLYVVRPTLAMADAGSDMMAAAYGASIGGVLGGLFGSIYPTLLLFFMTRRHIVAAFAGEPPAEIAATWSSSAPPPGSPVDSANPYGSPRTDALVPRNPAAIPTSESIVETVIPTKNGPALASYYLGLGALFPCFGFPLGIAAVYFGVKGLRRVRDNPAVRGGVHAWVGVICGGLFGLFNLALVVVTVVGIIAAASSP